MSGISYTGAIETGGGNSVDPRGPVRRIISVGDTPQTNHHVTLDCGHKPQLAEHFWYKVGADMHCMRCGSGEQPVSHGPRPDWKAIMAPSPPFGDHALLLMVADECDVTNPDGSAIPLSAALVAQIRAAVGQKID